MLNFRKLKKIKGDASFRKFYRNKKNNSIVVYSKKDRAKNLLIYDAINKILIKNKISAPKLLNQNYKNHYIEIEDLGDKTLNKVLKYKKINKKLIFGKIVTILKRLQSIKDRSIKNFKGQKYKVMKYSNKILLSEACLFSEWYALRKLNKFKTIKFEKKYKKEVKKLLTKLNFKDDTFVHRDFHVSNLMLVNNRIGVIDSQDALIGNRSYDLASLVDDVRLKTSKILKKKIFNLYIDSQKKLDKKKIKNDFEILSILRNLKIIGIFTRLAIRDKKEDYLKLIPNAWDLISLRINQNEVFVDLKKLLKDNFKKNL